MENPDQLYTIADIAREFSLPESTCRYYCKRFAPYIPSVGEGRRRRFRKETMAVIDTIVEEMKKSRTCTAVEDLLASRFPRTTVAVRNPTNTELIETQRELCPVRSDTPDHTDHLADQTFPPSVLAYMERQTIALEGIAKMLGVLAENICVPMIPERKNDAIPSLRKEIENLRILLDASEKNQQSDLDQIRTWVGKLVRRVTTAPPTSSAIF